MSQHIAAVPGVDLTDESKMDEVNGDISVLEEVPEKNEGCYFNKVPEVDADSMLVDDFPVGTAVLKQAKEEGHGKDVCLTNAIGIVTIAAASPSTCLGKVQDGCSVELRREVGDDVKREYKDAKKLLKRKRVSVDLNANYCDKENLKVECQHELDELFDYLKEVSGLRLQVDDGACPNNSTIAYLLEESNLPFSKLVMEVYDRLRGKEEMTLASVRGSILSIGQRNMYGVSSADADILEDESESCLWCWETRDIKLFPANIRGILSIRRMARKKIHERIFALSATMSALARHGHYDDDGSDLMKASIKLGKTLNKQGIFSFVEKLTQKNSACMAEKDAKLQQKEFMKEIDKRKQNAEKEKKKIERELQKEKLRSEKELKRLQEEAERGEKRRREKEEAELKKQMKKQQEDAVKEQRRREKEEADLKKQLTIQKQASMMERFLKSKKGSISTDDNVSPLNNSFVQTTSKNEGADNTITTSMDNAFSQQCSLAMEDICRLHISSWRNMAHHNRASHWGIRLKPKVELVKDLKLQRPSLGITVDGNLTLENKTFSHEVKHISESKDDKLDDVLESYANNMSCPDDLSITSTSAWSYTKKLLQFDKSHRPAYYGTWRRKSGTVGPRRPFRKDPELDYDVDSDEEWEEEDPGESLSDCDKDDKESVEVEISKDKDDTETEDSFVVPDGYLSDDEGVQMDTSSKPTEDESKSAQCKSEVENDEFRVLFHRYKFLCNLTEKSLQKSHTFILSNLNHEKSGLLKAGEGLVGSDKVEQTCLQALCMQAIPGGSIIEILTDSGKYDNHQEAPTSKEISTQATVISDMDLPELVKLIQSCSNGINKMVEMLQQKFPAISKLQLRNKIRELSEFVDNRWQVKKDVLEKLGLSVSQPSPTPPHEKVGKPIGITAYFSKRCLPPERESMGMPESSPSSSKMKPHGLGADGRHPSDSDEQFVLL